MLAKKQIIKLSSEVLKSLRDTKYATSDISERISLAKIEVEELRSALINADFASDAEKYAAKLKLAQGEYQRLLKLSHKRNIV